MKDIVIIANFCGDFSPTDNGRFMYLAKALATENKVEVITSDFSHLAKAHKSPLVFEVPFSVTYLHETGYPKNICLRRFYSHYTWGKQVAKYLSRRKRPDVVYCAVPSLTAPFAAAKYCKKHAVRFVIDIQDLWPEAFQMVFNIPVISDIIFAPFRAIANRIYRQADEICAVSRTYCNRALQSNRKCKETHSVFLGTKLEDFDANARNNPITTKPANELWLAYCGTLGASYDLTCVFDALVLLREQGKPVPKFIVMGDGPRKEEFEQYAINRKLDVLFTGRLPYDQMCGRLSACDIAVNPITAGAAQSIINKHGDYAAAGLPVLNTQENKEYRDLVDKYHMGLNCKNEDAADLVQKLYTLLSDQLLRKELGVNARRCAEYEFDRKTSYQILINTILD